MKATKKIVGAACALVAAVALSAGSTFAWFTSNGNVSVSQIEATVVTKGGDLRIAPVTNTEAGVTIGAYSYTLEAPEFEGKLDAVTTSNGFVFTTKKEVNKTTGVVDYSQALKESETKGTGAMYYTFSFALLSSTDMKVYLNSNTALDSEAPADAPSSSIVKAWKTAAASVYGAAITEGSPMETEAKNAARVAFLEWTNIENSPAVSEGAVTGVKSTQYYAPYDSADGSSGEGFYTGNLAGDYLAFVETGKLDLTAQDNYYVPDATKVVSVLADKDTINETTPETPFIELTANTPKIVTVSLWIEGRDGDCFNNIFAHKVLLDLAFYGKDVPAAAQD